jgi:hypothetical protein
MSISQSFYISLSYEKNTLRKRVHFFMPAIVHRTSLARPSAMLSLMILVASNGVKFTQQSMNFRHFFRNSKYGHRCTQMAPQSHKTFTLLKEGSGLKYAI